MTKNVLRDTDCFGCAVCAAVCRRKAITMKINDNGFYTPSINNDQCVECSLCLDVCALNDINVANEHHSMISCYASWSEDYRIRKKCSSGGVSYEIGRFLIRKGYGVIACRYNSQSKKTEHYLAEDEDALSDSVGSKYIQSYTLPGLSQIKKGRKYLIIGTPCQIDSVRRYIKKLGIESDVILMDFFCHGVPSMLMWDQYLLHIENNIGQFNKILWRDKETGWHDSWVIKVEDRYSSWFSKGDLFYKMFLKDRCLGTACYENCKYKYDSSAADIRVGDLWGRTYQENESGVSGIVCFSQKGHDLLQEMTTVLHLERSTLDIVGEAQMKKCAHKPISYNYVMRNLKKGTPLVRIDKVATIIEFFEIVPRKLIYYIKRFPSKLLEILNYDY